MNDGGFWLGLHRFSFPQRGNKLLVGGRQTFVQTRSDVGNANASRQELPLFRPLFERLPSMLSRPRPRILKRTRLAFPRHTRLTAR